MIIVVSCYEVLSMRFGNTVPCANLTGLERLVRRLEGCWEEVLYQVRINLIILTSGSFHIIAQNIRFGPVFGFS